MDEPRRWTLNVWAHGFVSRVIGDPNASAETVRVREDRATEGEKTRIAAWLEGRYGGPVRDHIGEWGGHEEWDADAPELLDLVLGEEASRV
jgi:hypothetical protein